MPEPRGSGGGGRAGSSGPSHGSSPHERARKAQAQLHARPSLLPSRSAARCSLTRRWWPRSNDENLPVPVPVRSRPAAPRGRASPLSWRRCHGGRSPSPSNAAGRGWRALIGRRGRLRPAPRRRDPIGRPGGRGGARRGETFAPRAAGRHVTQVAPGSPGRPQTPPRPPRGSGNPPSPSPPPLGSGTAGSGWGEGRGGLPGAGRDRGGGSPRVSGGPWDRAERDPRNRSEWDRGSP